ncbi:MAG: endolytic transglycosylase MltG [Rikenellaceae bacterium]
MVLLMAVGVGVAYRIFFSAAAAQTEVIYISSADLQSRGYESIVDSLIYPLITHHRAFDLYAQHLDLSQRIKAGRYEIREGMNVIEIVRILKLGVQKPMTLIFNNIRTPEQLAGRLASQIEADSLSVLSALSSPEVLGSVGLKSKEELISVFIPNSYEVYWTTSPEKLIARMKSEHSKFWTPQREAKREELGLSRLEVSTLASIVYEETAREDEMARVAGVYVNRLKRGMLLQADPTVKYAMGDFELKRVLFTHLKYDSPYNTYMYGGVPPSPIAMPSIAAIDAVLNYEKHKYLYFCARPQFDGYHNFATTLQQHNANSRAYSAELNRLKIK